MNTDQAPIDIAGMTEEEEDAYEEITALEEAMFVPDNELYQDDVPIYQNVAHKHNVGQSVYGEVHYSATGTSCKGKWDPSILKGVSSYPPDTDLKLEDFLKNDEEIVTQISNTPVNQRNPKHVEFLLHTVLPDLETKLTKNGITSDILRIILKLSCCKDCSVVTRYALHIILDTLLKTSYESGGIFADFLVQCELCLKDSIIGQVRGDISAFDHENAEDQGLRLFVYSRALIILYANVVQGLIPMATINENRDNFSVVIQKLTNLQEQNFFVQKDKARYAICCIKETVARLFPNQKKKHEEHIHFARLFPKLKKKHEEEKNLFHIFLTWLQEHNRSGEETESVKEKNVATFMCKIKTSRKGWFDFHVAVLCLGSQIHNKPDNVKVLQILVVDYFKSHSDCTSKWSSEGEWQTGLVLGSVLEYNVNYNPDRVTRLEVCFCLINAFKNLKKTNSIEKQLTKEILERCLYGPNISLRQVMLDDLELEGDKTEPLPITLPMDYLVQKYQKQIKPWPYYFTAIKNCKGYFVATFRGENATVKILESTRDDMVKEERKTTSTIHQQLVTEVYTLRRLNSKPHPNILRIFAYDTSAQPYHLITEHVSKGSLLQFLQSSRSHVDHMPGPSTLIQMILGVMDATIYLNELHLVHLAIMAANVLVGMDNVCKLTGFQYSREMTKQRDGSYGYMSVRDEMSIRHAAPECFTSGWFSEKSVSWAIGILLFEMHTYGVSPYNQFNKHEHEEIRKHVISRGKLKMEYCIRKEVCSLIQTCLEYETEKRPSLAQLKTELGNIYEQIKEDNDCPTESYPTLTTVDLAGAKYAMNSSSVLEEIEKDKILGYFGSQSTSDDSPMRISISIGKTNIRELVLKTKEADLEKLKKLKHKNIVEIHSLSNHDLRNFALVTEDSARGNLLQMILAKQCRPEDLVTFAAQIVQAMIYMHENDMIHIDLRAEHIMVFSTKVKVSRLGRLKHVRKSLDTKCRMPQDSIRWSAPEVIKDGLYSQSSDVYSFGVTFFELFNALSAPEGSTPEDVKPFSTIKDKQILAYLEYNHRPARPELMPIWFFIVMKQCMLHVPVERPSFILIEDALTSRKPFESCLLTHWKNTHKDDVDNIDVYVTQSEMAGHVIPKEGHKTHKELQKSASGEVFVEHTYIYVDPQNINPAVNEEGDYVSMAKENIYDRPRRPPLPLLPGEKLPVENSGDSTLDSTLDHRLSKR